MITHTKAYFFLYFSIYTLLSASVLTAQEKAVHLIEEKLKKRTILYVQNDTETDKSVFLKVNPIGYRRSAQRPIIKNIPAKSKVQMIILIPLTDVPSSYTYNLIVNEELQTMEIERSKNPIKEAPLSSVLTSEIVIFTKKDCKKCTLLITKLKKEHAKYREVTIDTKSRYTTYIWELLTQKGYTKTTAKLPLALKRGELIHPINNLDTFVQAVSKKNKELNR